MLGKLFVESLLQLFELVLFSGQPLGEGGKMCGALGSGAVIFVRDPRSQRQPHSQSAQPEPKQKAEKRHKHQTVLHGSFSLPVRVAKMKHRREHGPEAEILISLRSRVKA